MDNRFVFTGGETGPWQVVSWTVMTGPDIARAPRIGINPAAKSLDVSGAAFVLNGFTSNVRYAERSELTELRARESQLGRPSAHCAAIIPIKKSDAWWQLSQDERRAIFEETSHHTAIGLQYLPAVARKLYHCRDIGEPFDFITWFEFNEANAAQFDELVERLRATREWTYIEREIDIRLMRD